VEPLSLLFEGFFGEVGAVVGTGVSRPDEVRVTPLVLLVGVFVPLTPFVWRVYRSRQ